LSVEILGQPGSLVVSINASDGDGDTVIYSITSSNFDLDADGQKPFTVSSTGALSINDVDDLLPYAGSIVNVNLSLSDGKGMSTTISGALSIDNKLSLESTPVSRKSRMVRIQLVENILFPRFIMAFSSCPYLVVC
jgi:hypothetical protein